MVFVLLSWGTINIVHAQPGMYKESEIEFQTIFFEAQEAKYKGDTDKQIELLTKLIKRDKSNAAIYSELARTYLSLANTEMAQKNALKAHELDPKKEWYLLTLAEIYEDTEQRAKAITCYNKLKLINPSNPAIYHKLAQLLSHEKKPDEAVANLEQLQKEQGIEEESTRRIFDILKATGKEKKAIAALNNLIAAYPDNTRYLENLASYYMELNQLSQAEKIYDQIIKIEPHHPKANLVLAKKDLPKGNSDSKLSGLSPIIENENLTLDDKIKELMPYLTTMQKGDANMQELVSLSDKLVTMYPDEAKTYSLRGDVLFYQGNFTESEKSYKKAISLDDRKYTLWSQYLQNLWELGKLTEMKKISEEAIDLYPNKVSAFLYHAISQSAQSSKAKSFVEEAQMIAGKNSSLSTQILITKNWLAKKKLSSEQFDEIDLKMITEPIFFELAGDLYKSSGDAGMATKLYKQAIDLGADENRINQKGGD